MLLCLVLHGFIFSSSILFSSSSPHTTFSITELAQELCESRGGHPGLPVPVPNSPYRLCGRKATLKCESRGGQLGFPVPNNPYGLCGRKAALKYRAQELCESPGGRPGLPVPDSPYGLCGRKAGLNNELRVLKA